MVSEDQLGYLGYDGIAGRAWFAVGHTLGELFILEGHGSSALFGSSGRDGGLLEIGGGVRMDMVTPMRTMRVTPAAHINVGVTGSKVRPTFSLSVGLLLDISRAFSLGPLLQYGQVFQPDGSRYSSDARYFTIGIAMGYRPAPPLPPAPEQKHVVIEHHRTYEDGPRPEPPESPEPSPQLLSLIESAVEPLREAMPVRDESTLILPVLFEYDSVEFIPCGEAALFDARDTTKQRTGPVQLEGHADTTGDTAYNLDLARRRAERVRDWLVEHGVDAARLSIAAQGECCTLTEETDDSRRQLNRRVIIRFGDGP